MIKIGFIFYKIRGKIIKIIANYLNDKYLHKMKKFGKGSFFYGISDIKGLDKIEIGNNVKIGANAIIRGKGGLIIGNNVRVAKNIVIYTQNHNYKGDMLPYNNEYIYKEVIIHDNVWIGINVTILPGTIIEEGAVIGAGTVVFGKINKCEIIGAASYNELKYRDVKHYEELKSLKSIFNN